MAIDTKTLLSVVLGIDTADPVFIQQWNWEVKLQTIASTIQRDW